MAAKISFQSNLEFTGPGPDVKHGLHMHASVVLVIVHYYILQIELSNGHSLYNRLDQRNHIVILML